MAGLVCPFEGCIYAIPEVDPALAAAFLTTHALGHKTKDTPAVRAEKVRRPDITSAGSTESWLYFRTRWRAYVRATKIAGPDLVVQLLECCDDKLRKDMTRNAGGAVQLEDMSEEEVFTSMKALAVREENPKVARVALTRMKQDRDEPVRAYAARLRGQASVCKFTKPCTACGAITDQSEERVADAICVGLADAEIQADLLKDPNQNMSVEETLRFVEIRASGKRSATSLSTVHVVEELEDSQGGEAVGSSYKRQKATPQRATPQRDTHPTTTPTRRVESPQQTCGYCGGRGHGRRESARVRQAECPAYGKVCRTCNKENHTSKMCRSRHVEFENAVSDRVCDLTTTGPRPKRAVLEHHIYDRKSKVWIKRRSKPQPFIQLRVDLNPCDYKTLGHPLKGGNRVTTTEAMADTGCQSCLAGADMLRRLGLKREDLIPVNLNMHAANDNNLPIQGATILRLTSKTSGRSTRQMVYITTNVRKMYLSREACTDLGIIPNHSHWAT